MKIEKLNFDTSTIIDAVCAHKINQLCDAINELQEFCDVADKHLATLIEENNIHEKQIDELQMKVEIPVDQYKKEHRWIGCVCRFWYDNPDDTVLDYLGKIQTGKNGIEYYGKETYDWFPHCEPVKPDDSIIYKGE